MITELTKEQEAKIEEYKQYGMKVGTCTDPADRPRAEKAFLELYKILDLGKPQIVWVDSPAQAEEYINECNGTKNFNSTSYWGQHDMHWIAHYEYCRDVLGTKYSDDSDAKLKIFSEIANSCCWWYPYTKAIIAVERPVRCFLKEGRIHSEDGKAVEYRDGFGVYALNGIVVPEQVVMTPSDKITKEMIVGEKNTDVRREIIGKVGMTRLIDLLGYQTVDEYKECKLITFDVGDGRVRPYVLMECPSSNKVYIEGARPEHKTAEEAWRYQHNFGKEEEAELIWER